jgi:hypothetical protein
MEPSAVAPREVPASIGQKLLWYLERYRRRAPAINCAVAERVRGPLDVDSLQLAVDRVFARHEALRTTVVRRGRDVVQQIHAPSGVPIAHRAVATEGLSKDEVDGELRRLLSEEIATQIAVDEAPARVTLFRVGDDDHLLCVNMHHLISDAISCKIVDQDLMKFFAAGRDCDPGLPPVGWHYPEFSSRQHAALQSGELRVHQEYWMEKLDGMEVPALPLRSDAIPGPRAVVARELEPAMVAALGQLARDHRTTTFAVMLALYYLALSAETGQTDLTVGSLFANRSHPEVTRTVGFFANMVMLRTAFDPAAPFADTLAAVHRTVAEMFRHGVVPSQVVAGSGRPITAVDDVVFQFRMGPPGTSTRAGGLEFQQFAVQEAFVSYYGFELAVTRQDDSYLALLSYGSEHDPVWVEQLLDQYVSLATRAASLPAGARSAL